MTQRRRLEQTVAVVRLRYGPAALKKASSTPQAPLLPTGLPALDSVLGGGLPRGKCHELVGYGTAGHLTAAANILAQAQKLGQTVAYLDLGSSIDPELLVRRGVHLDRLVVLRPDSFRQALAMMGDLLRADLLVVAAFDRLQLPALLSDRDAIHSLQLALRQWIALLARSESTIVFLTELLTPVVRPLGLPLANLAHVRLLFEHRTWLYRAKQICGFETSVTVLKHKSGRAGQQISLRFLI